jgi:hypothetical protein
MTDNGKLKIVVMSKSIARGECVLNAIYKMELQNGDVEALHHSPQRLYTKNAIYYVVEPVTQCGMVVNYHVYGMRADQLIVDFTCYDPELGDILLSRSCVPYEFQVIDQEDILK